MEIQEIIKELIKEAGTKILLLVLDGASGVPVEGRTELEAASLPNLHALAKRSSCGLLEPVAPGISPGSGPAHLALFGYEPTEYIFGRGLLSALGVGVELEGDDLCARANFATKKDGNIIDRRAGRIQTVECERLCKKLSGRKIKETKIFVYPEKEHRAVVVFRGGELSEALTDSDPQVEGHPPLPVKSLKEEAKYTAEVVNEFLKVVDEELKGEWPANTMLLRGFAKSVKIPSFQTLYKMRACAICTYPMYKGLARLLGMDVVESGSNISSQIETLRKCFPNYDFFYFHIKEADMAGEDKDFEKKVKILEDIDKVLPDIIHGFDVVAVTADHSTPAALGAHSWHPVPLLLYSKYCISDEAEKFTEKECAKGILGKMNAKHLMPLLLANAQRLKKFGA